MMNKTVKIILCISIAVTLVVGGIFALVLVVRDVSAVVKLDTIRLDSGTVTYLAALYKLEYLESVDPAEEPSDTKAFWNKEKEEGVSYGEDFEEQFKLYLSSLVTDAHLYVSYHGYTAEDVAAVTGMTNNLLRECANGSVAEFNDVAEDLGFDFQFSDFYNAVVLRYQAGRAQKLLMDDMSEDEKMMLRSEAMDKIKFTQFYYLINVLKVPMINEYYVK